MISMAYISKMAERAGFEPAIRFPVYTLSRRAPSTTRPPLHSRLIFNKQYQSQWRIFKQWSAVKRPLRRGI